jgi:cobalt-zinc-cadmium efflux system outer membrane protein
MTLALLPALIQAAPLPAQLSLEDALRIFRQRGLDLIIAEAAVASAEGDLRAAGGINNPSLGLTYSHAFTYNPNSPDPSSSCSAANAN